MPFIFSIRCRDHAHISLQSRISEFHFPFTCNRYGRCFGISVYATRLPTSRSLVRVRVSPTIFFLTLFSFWPFTVPSPLIIKTRRIANNVINNPIFFIITLFSLNPLSYITILNRIPQGGRYTTFNHGHLEGMFSIASLSSPLLLFYFSSHVLPLSFFGLSLHLSISLLFHPLPLSLSLSCIASLLFSWSVSLCPTVETWLMDRP